MNKRPTHRITSRVEVPSSNSYYVWRDDSEFGPFNIRDIRQYWSAQTLTAADFIRESHSTDWIDASSFLLPLLTSDETHETVAEELPVPAALVVTIGEKPAPRRDGELGWGLLSVLTGLGGLAAAYFVGTHFLVTAALWLICLMLGIIGWWLYHNRSQLVLSVLFLAAIGLGVWPTSATSQTPPVIQATTTAKAGAKQSSPGTLLGNSPKESAQTWTSLATPLPGITDPAPAKLEATPAADLPPMPELQSTALTGIGR